MFESVEYVANTSQEPLTVWFEPWGMCHTLQVGETFRIVAQSDQNGQLEIERGPSEVAVYGWPGSTMQVFLGELLVDDFSRKFPELPAGMSVKSFIGMMFGGPGGPSTL